VYVAAPPLVGFAVEYPEADEVLVEVSTP